MYEYIYIRLISIWKVYIYIYDHICMYIQLINEANINKPTEIWGGHIVGSTYTYTYIQ